ncbi:MAG: 3-methyladenine DNA glycosylase [Legionellaceae bacterium]|nr:3-methyladenine DNA glycosylase [Legionellaceae bacterium]HCA89004.1 3-methyladenine DNA glycosylase [Legionellales bacterium]|tara:strand:+ start:4346 stop:4915 length:570 start_codon:yes stop_codon:yes gene_type:complete
MTQHLNFNKLPRSFYEQHTIEVARRLLGCYLIHQTGEQQLIGKIVETEAYLGGPDLAAHSSKGMTKRTQIMFGPAGFAYVYLIYGIHHCLNVVTESPDIGSAVLIRALEPYTALDVSTKGPGLLCRAFGITRALNGHDLLSSNFYIAQTNDNDCVNILSRPRIGIDYAGEWTPKLLRFYIKDNPFISKK